MYFMHIPNSTIELSTLDCGKREEEQVQLGRRTKTPFIILILEFS